MVKSATPVAQLPTGTATFLFTDIEGSTKLVQALGNERWRDLLETHYQLLRNAFGAHQGKEVSTEGDAFFVAFTSAQDAVEACVEGQRALQGFDWPEDAVIRVRMGLHTGEAALVGGDYMGVDIHRAARVVSAGHGGQVLLSESTRVLVAGSLPAGVGLRDLGEHRLKDLLQPEHIYQLDIHGLPDTFPAIKVLDSTPNNLPTLLTSFVGRERELEEGGRLLQGTHLLTLTGPGGTGKTRLSLQLAAESADAFPAGVYFVALATITDAALVAGTIARALGVQEAGSKPVLETVIEYLREREALLVLDNFEQILEASPIVSELLSACPKVKAIVSSRAALRVYGEQEFPVPPLGLPEPGVTPSLDSLSQYEAVRLFIDRAVAVKPDFAVTDENAPAVAAICARLDGLPLAIELAAARIKLLPPQAMLARLEQGLKTLGGGARDLPERQQTLFGAISWSYDLLDPAGRLLLARFSVFVRGATLENAETVCGPADELGIDVLDGLEALMENSLVRQREEEGEPRFWMLVTIRDFAVDRLRESDEADAVGRRHAEVFLAIAHEAEAELQGPNQKAWLDRLEREHDNLRAALAFLVSQGSTEQAMGLASALWRFWQMRGYLREGRERLESLLALPDSKAYPATRLKALEATGGTAYWQGQIAASRPYYAESLELARQLGDRWATANAAYNLGFTYVVEQGDLAAARELLDESIAGFRELDSQKDIARVLWAISSADLAERNFDDARRANQESLTILRGSDDRFGLGWTLRQGAMIALQQKRAAEAREFLVEALELFYAAGDRSAGSILMGDLAQLAQLEGDYPRAARLAGAGASMTEAFGTALSEVADRLQGRDLRAGLSAEDFAHFWEEGKAMSFEAAVAYALAQDG
jgi:predicted ATPase/class 3 adenylate cyclase